jgi:hypothetical protein
MNRLHRSGLAFLLLSATATAQGRTWTVDAANGPGTDFTDLPPAVAAAVDGDVLRVRPGSYSGVTIAKALTLLGGPGVNLRTQSGFLEVANVGLGKQVTVSGVNVTQPASPGVQVHDCQARVLFDRLVISSSTTSTLVQDCRQVELNGCSIRAGVRTTTWSGGSLAVVRSTVAISGCVLRGIDGAVGTSPALSGCPGLAALDSRVFIARSQLIGGDGTSYGSQVAAPGPGINTTNSAIVIAGDNSSRVDAGRLTTTMCSVFSYGGSIVLDPAVTMTPSGGGHVVFGPTPVTIQPLPALTAIGAPPDGVVLADLFSASGDLVCVLMSRSADEIPLTHSDSLWLDRDRFVVIAAGVQGPARHFIATTQVPNNPVLSGITVTQQALTLASSLALSNPASYAHN